MDFMPHIQDALIRAVVAEFRCRLTPRGKIAWIVGKDADAILNSVSTRAKAAVAALPASELPNVGIEEANPDRLILIDAASVRTPMDEKRKAMLASRLECAGLELVFVNAFRSRSELAHIAMPPWGSSAWFADEPDHIIEFDGERIRGP